MWIEEQARCTGVNLKAKPVVQQQMVWPHWLPPTKGSDELCHSSARFPFVASITSPCIITKSTLAGSKILSSCLVWFDLGVMIWVYRMTYFSPVQGYLWKVCGGKGVFWKTPYALWDPRCPFLSFAVSLPVSAQGTRISSQGIFLTLSSFLLFVPVYRSCSQQCFSVWGKWALQPYIKVMDLLQREERVF